MTSRGATAANAAPRVVARRCDFEPTVGRVEFEDRLAGVVVGTVDDVVLRRNDGVPAYNLAVVVDDGLQGVTEVVRGDDLLSSTPARSILQELLGLDRPSYLHVPLVVDDDGERLAKRRGVPLTLAELAATGVGVTSVISWIVETLGDRAGRWRWRRNPHVE